MSQNDQTHFTVENRIKVKQTIWFELPTEAEKKTGQLQTALDFLISNSSNASDILNWRWFRSSPPEMISILFALQNLFSAKTETFIKVNPLMPGGNKKVTYT